MTVDEESKTTVMINNELAQRLPGGDTKAMPGIENVILLSPTDQKYFVLGQPNRRFVNKNDAIEVLVDEVIRPGRLIGHWILNFEDLSPRTLNLFTVFMRLAFNIRDSMIRIQLFERKAEKAMISLHPEGNLAGDAYEIEYYLSGHTRSIRKTGDTIEIQNDPRPYKEDSIERIN